MLPKDAPDLVSSVHRIPFPLDISSILLVKKIIYGHVQGLRDLEERHRGCDLSSSRFQTVDNRSCDSAFL